MRHLVLLALMMIGLEASAINWHKSYAEAAKVAQKEKKPMLVYMHDDCGACQYLENKVFNQSNVSGYINQHFVAVLLEPKNDGPKSMQVKVAPVFHYVNYDGTSIQEDLIGATPASSFLQDLKIAVKESK